MRDSGVSIYKILVLEKGALHDDWVPDLKTAEELLEKQFNVKMSDMISTQEMVKRGYDMTKYNDPDFPT